MHSFGRVSWPAKRPACFGDNNHQNSVDNVGQSTSTETRVFGLFSTRCTLENINSVPTQNQIILPPKLKLDNIEHHPKDVKDPQVNLGLNLLQENPFYWTGNTSKKPFGSSKQRSSKQNNIPEKDSSVQDMAPWDYGRILPSPDLFKDYFKNKRKDKDNSGTFPSNSENSGCPLFLDSGNLGDHPAVAEPSGTTQECVNGNPSIDGIQTAEKEKQSDAGKGTAENSAAAAPSVGTVKDSDRNLWDTMAGLLHTNKQTVDSTESYSSVLEFNVEQQTDYKNCSFEEVQDECRLNYIDSDNTLPTQDGKCCPPNAGTHKPCDEAERTVCRSTDPFLCEDDQPQNNFSSSVPKDTNDTQTVSTVEKIKGKTKPKWKVKLHNYSPGTSRKRKQTFERKDSSEVNSFEDVVSAKRSKTCSKTNEPVITKYTTLTRAQNGEKGTVKSKKSVKWLDLSLPDSVNKFLGKFPQQTVKTTQMELHTKAGLATACPEIRNQQRNSSPPVAKSANSTKGEQTAADVDQTVNLTSNSWSALPYIKMTGNGSSKTYYQCIFCEDKFQCKRAVREHVQEDHEYNCIKCRTVFTSREQAGVHKKIHAENGHRCDVCDKAFSTLKTYQNHLKSVLHKEVSKAVRRVLSEARKKQFNLDGFHLASHYGESPVMQ